jgi:hypothetical protein
MFEIRNELEYLLMRQILLKRGYRDNDFKPKMPFLFQDAKEIKWWVIHGINAFTTYGSFATWYKENK